MCYCCTMSTSRLPRKTLLTALKLRDPLKRVFLALSNYNKPATAAEIAEVLHQSRPYVHMRLNQLVDMKLVKKTGSTPISFEVIR
jgi:predicted transcriptional regulator